MYQSAANPTDTRAPIPAAFAVLGLESFHTSQRIKPTTGIQHPKIPYPTPPSSLIVS